MTDTSWRQTGAEVPEFDLSLLDGGSWSSLEPIEGRFRLLNIYRGKWCGQCKKHLKTLDKLMPAFRNVGVEIIAASADTRERAAEFADMLEIENLSIGFEFPMEAARELGVFVSARAKDEEMPLFFEPAHFLIGANHRVFAAWISSCAFARTSPQGILDYVEFIGERTDRVPRGSA